MIATLLADTFVYLYILDGLKDITNDTSIFQAIHAANVCLQRPIDVSDDRTV